MRVSPEDLIISPEKIQIQKNIFLITGNDLSLIEKIKMVLVSILNKSNFLEVEINENQKINHKIFLNNQASLLSDKKIIIHKNPKEIDTDCFENIKDGEEAIIIIDTKIKNSSKIKQYFEKSKNLISITCYTLTDEKRRRIIDNAFSSNNIKIQKDGYWYFIDNSDEQYLMLENEIKKIISYGKKEISLNEVRLLLSGNFNKNIDDLFFLILSSQYEIIKKSRAVITSQNDGYLLLIRVKYYFDLYLNSKNFEEASEKLPRYMFLSKDKYLQVYRRLNIKKISLILGLIKKTEILLRKNSSMYESVSQRFLLNIRRCLI